MRRLLWIGAFLLVSAPTASAQYYFDYPKYARFETGVFVFGGQALNNGRTNYSDSWHDRLLVSVFEKTIITQKSSLGGGAGLFFGFFFNRTLGAELLLESSASPLKTTAEMSASWMWADYRNVKHSATWLGTGRLSTTRISFNLVNRFPGRFRDLTFSGGVTAFRHAFTADSWFGFGVSKLSEDGQFQLMDILKVGLRLPKTAWWALGIDFGIGYTHKLSERIGIKAEIRGFMCPAKTVSWTFVEGLYDGEFYGQMRDEPFGKDSVAFVTKARTLSGFAVKPSSVRLGLGLTWSSAPVVEY